MCYPAGLVIANKAREINNDYESIAFISYRTKVISYYKHLNETKLPAAVIKYVEAARDNMKPTDGLGTSQMPEVV